MPRGPEPPPAPAGREGRDEPGRGTPHDALLERIAAGDVRVGIIGLGYVGLPLARAFCDHGIAVLGFDVDPAKVERLRRGESYIKHISPETVRAMRQRHFEPTADFRRLDEPDAILICVPTPLTESRDPDLTYVVSSARSIAERLRPGQLVVLESTTYPGTTRDVVLPILTAGGLRAGADFFLAFSPEREDPGNPQFSAPAIPKVVGGLDPASLELASALYGKVVVRVVPVSSPEVAEASKILENTYRAVNIALVNELKVIYSRMGIDVWEVIEAARTKPFGFQAFYPGPGLGGHCLAGSETVRVRGPSLDTVLPLSDLFERIRGRQQPIRIGDAEVVGCPDLETLSIDPETGVAGLQPASLLFRRPFQGVMIEIQLAGNRRLRVTDRHPMLVVEEDRLSVRLARDLRPGDRLPQLGRSTPGDDSPSDDPCIDLLSALPDEVVDRLHVRLRDLHWGHLEPLLKARYGGTVRDSIEKDSLSARRFLELEPELKVGRDRVMLLSGRGSSHTSFPALLQLTPDFCRLLGYYLSEGCITEDGGIPRVRFTFHREEEEFNRDVREILAGLGGGSSARDDRTWRSTTVRAGWVVLGHVLRDELRAGRGSLTMKIPAVVTSASPRHHEAVVSGLLRGDGDVDIHTGLRAFRKRGRKYRHALNSGQVGYFSSSAEPLAQAENLLLGLGLHCTRKKGRPHIRMAGRENLERLAELLGGDKGRRLQQLADARLRPLLARSVRRWSGGTSVAVVGVTSMLSDESVYSLEVPGHHTFATTGGIFVHNCIPIDPFYLTWVARKHGLSTRFIELAGEVNTAMPAYVISKVADALNDRRKSVKGSKITLLGMAYKRDVDDPRESPGFELMEQLLERGAEVEYNDPHIPALPAMRRYPELRMASRELTEEYLASRDCVLIITDHSAYDWSWIARHATLIVDTRGATRGVADPKAIIIRA
jgi:UDP-N-acetyl-D-mannosaminuronate dehydrogenase/intein/homing endonuclease